MASNPADSDVGGGADLLIRDALEQLACVKDELFLDFSTVRRIDPHTLQEMDRLASAAQDASVRVTLRNLNAEVYKALKLSALAERFSFS